MNRAEKGVNERKTGSGKWAIIELIGYISVDYLARLLTKG